MKFSDLLRDGTVQLHHKVLGELCEWADSVRASTPEKEKEHVNESAMMELVSTMKELVAAMKELLPAAAPVVETPVPETVETPVEKPVVELVEETPVVEKKDPPGVEGGVPDWLDYSSKRPMRWAYLDQIAPCAVGSDPTAPVRWAQIDQVAWTPSNTGNVCSDYGTGSKTTQEFKVSVAFDPTQRPHTTDTVTVCERVEPFLPLEVEYNDMMARVAEFESLVKQVDHIV